MEIRDGVVQENHEIVLTVDQERAVVLIRNWFFNKGASPVWKRFFVLAGAAGTGKSSVIRYIVRSLRISEEDVLCCAFTGKASLNLRRKGNRSATLHSALYDCRRDMLGNWRFFRKESIPYKLIVVDESSMISEELFDDITSFAVPVIFIGDHCQLPPIEGKFNLMENPDFTLETILRQAGESPVIRASQLAVRGKRIPFCEFRNFRKIRQKELRDSDFLWADQIIVGTNATRKALNSVSREIRGITSYAPVKGERMIVLRNNSRKRICNGQIIYLTGEPRYWRELECFYADYLDELEISDPLLAVAAEGRELQFRLKDPSRESYGSSLNDFAYLDFGYAISCHKSQGSGWDKVMVFDEGFGFDPDTRRRWLYTAITRARKEIIIVSP